jgi:nitrogen fixation protein NifQ
MGAIVEQPVAPSLPADAVDGDEHFDRQVLGRMLLQAGIEAEKNNDTVADRLGLDGEELVSLKRYLQVEFDNMSGPVRRKEAEEEEMMVRELLGQNVSLGGPVGSWLSCIVARRALEPNHLWEDLGLAQRGDLSKLFLRHFFPLATKNTRNMRWKKFLYRSLCEAEGFSMCPSPTCDACPEFDICYGDESGQSVLARNNRQAGVSGPPGGVVS